MLKSLCQRRSHLGVRGISQNWRYQKVRRRFHVSQHTFRTAFRLLVTLQDSLLLSPRADSSLRSLATFPACVSASFGRSARRANWRPMVSLSKG